MTQFVKFAQLPTDLISYTASFCEPKTQNQLRTTNKRIQSAVDLIRQVWSLPLPMEQRRCHKNHIGTVPPLTLVKLLKRFPNITQLILPRFSTYHADIILPLMTLLQDSYPPKLKAISLHELNFRSEDPKLTADFFKSFLHSQIRSLEVSYDSDQSSISDKTINGLLEKTSQLTSFVFKGCQFLAKVNIHFSKCHKLEKIQLYGMQKITQITIDQIRTCKNLTELTLCCSEEETKLSDLLSSRHGLKLKRLTLTRTSSLSTDESLDLATRQLPDLEVLCRSGRQTTVSDEGFGQLAKNCRKLTTLMFNFKNMTDQGLSQFALYAPQLEKVCFSRMSDVTFEGVFALTQNCKKLKALRFLHFNHLNPEVLKILGQCKNLVYLDFFLCNAKRISLQVLEEFVTACKPLKHLKLAACFGVMYDDVKTLQEKFPFLEDNVETFHTI